MKAGRSRKRQAPDPGAAFRAATADTEVIPADLHAEALRCRAEFTRQRSQATGAPEIPPGKASWKYFIKAARIARDRLLTPELFTAAVMERAAIDSFFRPAALTSERYVNQAMGGLQTRTRYQLGLYQAQLDRFTALLKFGSAASILQAYGSEFTPLLRYIMARKFNEPALAGSSKSAACHELLIHPEARQVFGKWLEETSWPTR